MVVFKLARDMRFAGEVHTALSRDPAGRNLPGRGWRRLEPWNSTKAVMPTPLLMWRLRASMSAQRMPGR